MEKLVLKTKDGAEIAANYYAAENPEKSASVLLVHMMPATKESYDSFAKKLNEGGFSALAIDLRGHGESSQGPKGFKEFTNEEHQKSIEDVKAGVDFLREKCNNVFLCGASIGASLSLWEISENENIEKAILLSPGTNYKGIHTVPIAHDVSESKWIFISASEDDPNVVGNVEQSQEIFENLKCKKKIRVFEKGGHGTDILDSNPEFMDELIEWFG